MATGLRARARVYRRLDPKMVQRDLVPPMVAVGGTVFVLSLLVAIVAVQAGLLVRLAVVLVPTALAAGWAGRSKMSELDRLLQRQHDLPDLVSSARLTLRWATRDDEDALRTSMDEVMRDENGWSQDLADRALLTLQVPLRMHAARWWVGCDPESGALVGYTTIEEDRAHGGGRLLSCALAPAWRGKGYSTELIRLAVASDEAIEPDATPLGLATAVHNTAMRRATEAVGGREVARYDHTLPNRHVLDAVRYQFGPPPPPEQPAS